MTPFTSLRARLVGTVLFAIAPAWVFLYYTRLPWAGFAVGLLALAAAWVGGECFVLRQVRQLLQATEKLAEGDLSSRTGLRRDAGELGELAVKIDLLAARIQERAEEREHVEKTLLNRSLQQTVVSALGQFALISTDISALLNQVTMLVTQTLEVEYCGVFELEGENTLRLKAGMGWQERRGNFRAGAEPTFQLGYALKSGEPIVVEHLLKERRFRPDPFLVEHGVLSGITVSIPGSKIPFGLLGAYTTNRRIFTEDEVHFLLAVATVLAMAVERGAAAAKLERLAKFAQLNPNPAMELGADASLTYYNEAAQRFATAAGYSDPQPCLPAEILEIVRGCLRTGQNKLHYHTQHHGKTLSWSFHPVGASQVVHVYVEDVTERLSLEAQLRQSQKMESVGQLAAGMAHDFNNMLTVIIGHVGMMLANPKLGEEMRGSIEAISFASERATSLTRQLLVFSRKNIMQSKQIDVRNVVKQMSKMVQRLLGETISLRLELCEEAPVVQADAGMVEQVIMNLAVNARDAMPKGGKLFISVDKVTIDDTYLRKRTEARPGEFMRLSVRDTGTGMDEGTLARIFEPFFTTKEVGKGTGLGLATVYGIAKQHEGWVDVTTEVGKGSTFNVFFPATDVLATGEENPQSTNGPLPNGQETILVVEDEAVLREMAKTILESCGYRVLEAGSGPEALRAYATHERGIDLVLTDMVMPEGMSGLDLAHTLLQDRPTLPIVFASGYSMEDMDTHIMRRGNQYLQKPYTHFSLAKAVRESLDAQRQ